MAKLAPGQTFKHSCGLVLRNIRKTDIVFPEDVCPQCRGPIVAGQIRNAVPSMNRLTLIPPHGMAFKNELGSEVTLTYEQGRELELFQTLQQQLQQWIEPILRRQQGHSASGSGSNGEFVGNVVHAAKTAAKFSINDNGEIVCEDNDGPPPAASP
jgi:hypothetical protein